MGIILQNYHLTIYKEKLSEIVSFENIDFYKVIVDKRLKSVKHTMIAYVVEDLIAHPISHRDLKYTLDTFFNIWAEKNNKEIDVVADDLLAHSTFNRWSQF